MQRYSLADINHWYQKKDRPPLIIRGARQVGKSTLVRQFCAANKIDIIEINLEKTRLSSTQSQHFEIQKLVDEIQLLFKKKIEPGSLIFFDEIQEDPQLLKLLRYFYEEAPQVPVIAAGSLLEIVLGREQISFPVGRVEFLNLGPMSFFEFLKALDQEFLIEKMQQLEFTPALHAVSMEYLKVYTYTGGMPKVVDRYRETKSLLEVRGLQNQIVETYKSDFPKYANRINLDRITRVFESAATHLGRKVKYQEIDEQSKARETRRVLELLTQARIILMCYHCEASGTPLWATEEQDIYKLYFLDIGLVNAIHGLDYRSIENEISEKFVTKGFLAEQFVAQHLNSFYGSALTPRLNFWLRDKGASKGEVDFLIQHRNQIIPIEVKASAGGQLKSLFYFSSEKQIHKAIKISTHPFAYKTISHIVNKKNHSINLIELPFYAIEVLTEAMDSKFPKAT